MQEIYLNRIDDLLKWKEHCLVQLLQFARPSRLAELGCGSGFVVGIISEHFPEYFPEGRFIAVDRDSQRLASLKLIPVVYPVCGDIRSACQRDRCIDTALIISTLHEVYSQSGEIGVGAALSNAARILKYGGRLILYDRVSPKSRKVMLDFIDPDLKIRFTRFAKDFRLREVEYAEEGSKILLDIVDAFEFIEQFALETGEDWDTKLRETNLFFTKEEYYKACRRAGMNIVKAFIWKEDYGTPDDLIDRMIIDVLFRRAWIGIVAEKVDRVQLEDLP